MTFFLCFFALLFCFDIVECLDICHLDVCCLDKFPRLFLIKFEKKRRPCFFVHLHLTASSALHLTPTIRRDIDFVERPGERADVRTRLCRSGAARVQKRRVSFTLRTLCKGGKASELDRVIRTHSTSRRKSRC